MGRKCWPQKKIFSQTLDSFSWDWKFQVALKDVLKSSMGPKEINDILLNSKYNHVVDYGKYVFVAKEKPKTI
jgi:hypothetical protein